jgi:arabinan endo-1,5-alpha-L-arabinosidase
MIGLIMMTMVAVCMGQSTYTNPVVSANSPDPGAVYYDGLYWVVTTSNYGSDKDAYPIRSSPDLVHWTQVGYVFPDYKARKNPQWAIGDMYDPSSIFVVTVSTELMRCDHCRWAPEIHIINNSTFNVYYTARHSNQLLSIGVATASSITGPYTDIGTPLLQNKTEGVIDCHFFRDYRSGQPYLTWKVDGNAHGNPTPIYAAALRGDGLAINLSTQTLLLINDQQWEGPLVEGPWIVFNTCMYPCACWCPNRF